MGLRRAKRDRWFYGVCGGIAHRFGYKPWAVRLAVAVAAVVIPGFSLIPTIVVYVILGNVLPETDLY
jgi:phage shock protein PspC (stress-responsive transcriptional regulator)